MIIFDELLPLPESIYATFDNYVSSSFTYIVYPLATALNPINLIDGRFLSMKLRIRTVDITSISSYVEGMFTVVGGDPPTIVFGNIIDFGSTLLYGSEYQTYSFGDGQYIIDGYGNLAIAPLTYVANLTDIKFEYLEIRYWGEV